MQLNDTGTVEYLRYLFSKKIEEATALEWKVTAKVNNLSVVMEFEREGVIVRVSIPVLDLFRHTEIDKLADEYVPLAITLHARHLEMKRNREREVNFVSG